MMSTVRHPSRIVIGLGLATLLGIGALVTDTQAAGGHAQAPAPRTVTVIFTATGPVPASAGVSSGDSVRFVNHAGSVLPVGGVRVKRVTVTVTGAAPDAFTLPSGAAITIGPYSISSTPSTIHYTARYTASGGTQEVEGDITIGDAGARLEPCPPGAMCPMQGRRIS